MSLESEAEFVPAPNRSYIPREGFYPDAKYQLSVAPHPGLNVPVLINMKGLPPVMQLQSNWQSLTTCRIYQEGYGPKKENGPKKYETDYELATLPEIAFAPNTEQLFKTVIVPAIKKHALDTGRKQLAVDYVSYLFPFWSRLELGDDVEIVEGELARLIKEGGSLPDAIGAVYLDFPPNQQKRDVAYDFNQLVRFIRRHPSVLFIVDQANLYFSLLDDNRNDLMLRDRINPDNRLTDGDLVIVTNSTTKAMGKSACAVAAGTRPARELMIKMLGVQQLPVVVDFDEDSLLAARQSLLLETPTKYLYYDNKAVSAYEFRRTIDENRGRLTKHLESLFRADSTCPELVVGGARIILNAETLGFENAEALCEALYGRFSIATKPASVYASPRKANEFAKYVHMTIPWSEEIMDAVLTAFDQLKNHPLTNLYRIM